MVDEVIEGVKNLEKEYILKGPGPATAGNSGQSLPAIEGCGTPQGYYDTPEGRIKVNYMHAQTHIRMGGDMFDTGTSPNDMSAFTGHHANLDRSNMHWMMASRGLFDESENWGFPMSTTDVDYWKPLAGQIPYGTSGPYSTYALSYCRDPKVTRMRLPAPHC